MNRSISEENRNTLELLKHEFDFDKWVENKRKEDLSDSIKVNPKMPNNLIKDIKELGE